MSQKRRIYQDTSLSEETQLRKKKQEGEREREKERVREKERKKESKQATHLEVLNSAMRVGTSHSLVQNFGFSAQFFPLAHLWPFLNFRNANQDALSFLVCSTLFA